MHTDEKKDIRKTSQSVRSDLTTQQQYRLIITARKAKEIRTIAEGRGQKLKANEFPDLVSPLWSMPLENMTYMYQQG